MARRGNGKKDNSLVKLAYEHDVPIFCPAFTDSSAGFGLVKHQVDAMKRGGHYMTLDSIADFRELTDIKIKAGTTGLLMIGGGVPKNFAQDTVVCAEILGHEDVECTNMRSRSPSPTSATAPAPPRRSRKRRAGARSDRDGADGVRGGDQRPPAARQRCLAPRRLAQPREAPLRQAVRLIEAGRPHSGV